LIVVTVIAIFWSDLAKHDPNLFVGGEPLDLVNRKKRDLEERVNRLIQRAKSRREPRLRIFQASGLTEFELNRLDQAIREIENAYAKSLGLPRAEDEPVERRSTGRSENRAVSFPKKNRIASQRELSHKKQETIRRNIERQLVKLEKEGKVLIDIEKEPPVTELKPLTVDERRLVRAGTKVLKNQPSWPLAGGLAP
jgi:hypothetical protein